MRIVITVFLLLILINKILHAHGECCLSRSLAEATISGVTIAPNIGLSLQYEYTNMKTIKEGSHRISHNSVLNDVAAEWSEMPEVPKSFSIPTRMVMQKYTLLGSYAVAERLRLLASVSYVINDMDMRTLTRSPTSDHHHHHTAPLVKQAYLRTSSGDMRPDDKTMDMEMDTVEGLGDMTLMGLYTLYIDKSDSDKTTLPTKKLTLGLGVKTPTGKNDEVFDSGNFVHAAMQPGTGSWDPLFLVNYMHAFNHLVFQTNLLYHMTTEGDEGYEFGDKVSFDLIARYQLTKYINPGLEFNGFYAGQDTDHDGRYSRPDESLLDNTDNTGITSLSISPSIQVKIPKTGGSFDFKFQKPIYQDVRGIQQIVDWRAIAAMVWTF